MSAPTELEQKLFLIACKWCRAYHDSNPDVGMGMFSAQIIAEVATEAHIVLSMKLAQELAEKLDRL